MEEKLKVHSLQTRGDRVGEVAKREVLLGHNWSGAGPAGPDDWSDSVADEKNAIRL